MNVPNSREHYDVLNDDETNCEPLNRLQPTLDLLDSQLDNRVTLDDVCSKDKDKGALFNVAFCVFVFNVLQFHVLLFLMLYILKESMRPSDERSNL